MPPTRKTANVRPRSPEDASRECQGEMCKAPAMRLMPQKRLVGPSLPNRRTRICICKKCGLAVAHTALVVKERALYAAARMREQSE